MKTVNTLKEPRTTRKKAIVKGANKKSRTQRPKLVLNDTKDLVIVKHRMEQAEAIAPMVKLRGRRKAQIAQLVAPAAVVIEKKLYTGKPRGRKSNATLALEAALLAVVPKVARKVTAKVVIVPTPVAATKRGPGRPAKVVVIAIPMVATKRGPGRPAKAVIVPVEALVAPIAVVAAKRSPGRPAKVVEAVVAPIAVVAIKRGPGRPAKAVEVVVVAESPIVKRGRKPKPLMVNNEPVSTVKLDDWAVFHSEKGHEDYKALLRFMQEYSVPVKQAIGLLSGVISVPTEEALTAFKLGNFRIKNMVHAEHAAKLRNSMRQSAPTIYYKATFTNALARVSAIPGFSDKQLQKNMGKFFMGLEKVDTIEGFERQILEIYNTNLVKKDRLMIETA